MRHDRARDHEQHAVRPSETLDVRGAEVRRRRRFKSAPGDGGAEKRKDRENGENAENAREWEREGPAPSLAPPPGRGMQ